MQPGILPGMPRLRELAALLLSTVPLLFTLHLRAQTGTPPELTRRPYAPYPERARKAHISGEAIVAFSIDRSGKTAGVHAVSGPDSLTRPLESEIRGWRFVTPLPQNAERDFVADYTFSLVGSKEHAESEAESKASGADGNDPGDVPGPIAAVSGVVRSATNRQMIDTTPYVK